ncbi:MAG: PEP-CTERM sorting domain-containing protein [Chthoniobacterales bacterium]|nr:PEP-CTERM sorting domain-containing protein [Chthoniobacterales bacterium]
MKTHTIIRYLAALLLGAVHHASAAVVPDPAPGDLFLGFRVSGGQGAGESYLVNLGQYSVLAGITPGETLLLSGLGNIGADLSDKFGSDWITRDDLYWGVFGRSGAVVTTVFASRERISLTEQSTPWPSLGAPARDNTGANISAVWEGIGGIRSRESTTNSAVATFQPSSTEASSYNKQVATPGTTDFGTLSQWSSIEGSFDNGTAGTALDLYRIGSTGVTYAGYFTIDDSAALSFTAVPEPSTYVLIGFGIVSFLAWRLAGRRRQSTP